jgi:ribosomal protein S18 acetylase RimI-like enzyme
MGCPTIRPATSADAEAVHTALLDLARDIGQEGRVSSTVDDIRRHGFGPAPAFEALVAEADGVLVGLCLHFPSFSTWKGRRGTYVQDLYVAAAHRGTGLARRLLAAVAARTRERGGTYLRLSVDADNVAAQRFYARTGFEWSARERIHTLAGPAFENLATTPEEEDHDEDR